MDVSRDMYQTITRTSMPRTNTEKRNADQCIKLNTGQENWFGKKHFLWFSWRYYKVLFPCGVSVSPKIQKLT